MKLLILVALCAVCTAKDVVRMNMKPAEHYEKVDSLHAEWSAFKKQFNKAYNTVQEDAKRFSIFTEHSLRIARHNILHARGEKSYQLGHNHFSDMTHQEWLQQKGRCYLGKSKVSGATFLKPNNYRAPDSVDWRQKGYVTAVKDQGRCGSCWAFSTTGSMEGQNFRKNGKLVSLSEQQLVDCSSKFGNMGCNGGLMDQAFQYIKSAGGLESEKAYPYIDHDHSRPENCHFDPSKVAAKDTGFVDVLPRGDEDKLKEAVGSVGPVSVAIDANHQNFMLYKSGVFDEPDCSSTQLDHGVLVVGYGSENGQQFWLVKNSWNTVWGEQGYIKMARNKSNQCGIATQASYPLV